MELKKELIRTSNEKTSSSIKHAKTEQVLMHLLEVTVSILKIIP